MPAKSLPSSAPRNSEAKNRPPRKPEPIETAEAASFSSSRISERPSVTLDARGRGERAVAGREHRRA